MAWLNYLIEKGFLNPEQNPDPVAEGKGIIVPRWEPLAYLEKLSIGFQNGENQELIDPVLNVIRNTSETPKDNYYTWYVFIKILTNTPNEKIPLSILKYIPIWMSGRFDTMLQSSEIINKLLPKFLNDNSTADDIQKAEFILSYLFELDRITEADPLKNPGKTYFSKVYKYYLKEAIIRDKFISQIIKYLDEKIIFKLIESINLLIRDYAIIAEFSSDDKKYQILLIPIGEDLEFKIKNVSSSDPNFLHDSKIENYYDLDLKEIVERIQKVLDSLGINSSETLDEAIKRITFTISSDFHSLFGHNPIESLQDDTYHDDELIHIFPLILRELLSELATQRPKELKSLLNVIISQKKYNLPFFKRMVFYIVANTWDEMKSVFFDMIKEDDPEGYFSRYVYHNELHYLLRNVQNKLEPDEIQIISSILDKGPQTEKEFEPEYEVWKHRWLDALKENDHFKDEYKKISEKFDLGNSDYVEEGKVKVTSGSMPPFTADEILQMSDEHLLQEVLTFKNEGRFNEPSTDGFGTQLMKVAETNPEKFARVIKNYRDAPYLYIYYILLGITTAWRNLVSFEWKPVLEFCKEYVQSEQFIKDKLNLTDDSVRSKKEWVLGAIGRLISEGTRDDKKAIDNELLPLVKEILLDLVSNLQKEEIKSYGDRIDYPMVSLNSTAGQVLRGVLDYALRKARIENVTDQDAVKWEPIIKDKFESTFQNGIIDSYILIGMYFQQFYFLDKVWVESKVTSFNKLEEKLWLAFMGGLSFTAPGWNRDIYNLLYPHYERALSSKTAIDTHYHHGIIRHITAYYLWDYDTLSAGSLMKQLIEKSDTKNANELIQFLWQQDKHMKNYSEAEQDKIKVKVMQVWKMIAERFEKNKFDETDKTLENLIHLADYMDHLDEANTALILKSIPYITEYSATNGMLEALLRLKEEKAGINTPFFIGNIIEAMPFDEYMHEDQQKMIKELVIYLFENNQRKPAEFLCNKLTIKGYDFLKEIFYRYKE